MKIESFDNVEQFYVNNVELFIVSLFEGMGIGIFYSIYLIARVSTLGG
tara:strand:- start:730 stop:873 length:144 start_codon:yes stop_codon:yes gene_type:complete